MGRARYTRIMNKLRYFGPRRVSIAIYWVSMGGEIGADIVI